MSKSCCRRWPSFMSLAGKPIRRRAYALVGEPRTAKASDDMILLVRPMKYLFLLPLFGAAALLTGCAVEPAYVEGGPGPVYGPQYYAPEPVYGGTTVVSIEHDRYVDRDRYYNDRGYRTSRERRFGGSHDYRSPRRGQSRYGQHSASTRNVATAPGHKPDARKKNQKHDQH